MPTGTREYASVLETFNSPLAKALFQIDGVRRVFLGPDFVSIHKDEDLEWYELKPQIFSVIAEFYASGKAVITDEQPSEDTMILPEDDESVQMIKELIEANIRPAVQRDGGDVRYHGFVDGVVLLELQGACRGCSSSSITLKAGIERLLMHYVPDVNAVMAVENDEVRVPGKWKWRESEE